jgi:predicted TIM-barrel fold metal-dependent hydrolase
MASMSRAEAHRRERQAPDDAARDAAPPPERDPTIDAHHHLWDLQAVRYPWLVDPPVAAHFGPYEKIRQDYRVEQFLRDIRNQHVVKSVHVEAGADPGDAVRETRWLQGVADHHGFPHAIVARADLGADDVESTLEGHLGFANVRGIRMLTRRPGELRANDSGGSLMGNPAWRRGFERLGALGLSFDLQAPPPFMTEAAALAADFPDTPIVLTHAGLPLDRSADGLLAWRSGMRRLAERPNVWVKVSGLPMTDWHWTVESLRPLVLETIDIFGVTRAMFGSNFPVDGLYSDYDTLVDAYRTITVAFTPGERRALFHDNAQRFYRL